MSKEPSWKVGGGVLNTGICGLITNDRDKSVNWVIKVSTYSVERSWSRTRYLKITGVLKILY